MLSGFAQKGVLPMGVQNRDILFDEKVAIKKKRRE
jgi:hypothetical protein